MSALQTHSKALDAATFVLAEIARINGLPVEERMARIRTDKREAMGMLWGHPDYHPLECGWAARMRFTEIVEYARGRHATLARNVSWDNLSRAVTYAFIDRFIRKGIPLSPASLQSVVDGASRHVSRGLQDHRLVIPCRLWTQDEPAEITVGPVRFIRTEHFLNEQSPTRDAKTPEQLYDKAMGFLRQSGWIAMLDVPGVDSTIANERADAAIDAAINVLRVFIGPSRTRMCRRARSWGPPATHSHFRLSVDKTLLPAISFGGTEEIVYENWPDLVTGSPDRAWAFAAAGASVIGLVTPETCTPLQLRFLDALKWFGDGASDSSVAARIVKHVFAWERLVVTRERQPEGEDEGQTAVVTQRIARLCEQLTGVNGEPLRKQLSRLYDARSRLVHGSQSPWDTQQLTALSTECEAITVRALLGALRYYMSISQGAGSDDDLERSFRTNV